MVEVRHLEMTAVRRTHVSYTYVCTDGGHEEISGWNGVRTKDPSLISYTTIGVISNISRIWYSAGKFLKNGKW